MRICILLCKRFEGAFENAQWRKAQQMQPVWLCICSRRQFEDTFENAQWKKSNKCNQCQYACSLAGYLRTHIWKNTVVKSRTNATNLIMHPLTQVLWRRIWKCTVEKSRTNVISVILHPFRQAIWGHIWKNTVEKSETILRFIWKDTMKKNRPSWRLIGYMTSHCPHQYIFLACCDWQTTQPERY